MSDEPNTPNSSDPGGTDGESLADAFWGVAHQLRHSSRETFGPLNVTPGQARALRVLNQHGPMRLSELAEHLRIAPRSTTEVVDELQQRGLAERTPDPKDRRATRVAVTEDGRVLQERIRAARIAEAERLFGGLSADDRVRLARILGQLRRGGSA